MSQFPVNKILLLIIFISFLFLPEVNSAPSLFTYLSISSDIILTHSRSAPADTVVIRKEQKKERKSDRLFENFEEKAIKKRWVKKLHNVIIIPPSKHAKSDTLSTEFSASRYLEYEGLKINEIRLVKLDPFNVSIRDSVRTAGSLLKRTANTLHVKTHDRIIEMQLLIKPGDKIDPRVLADNERLLRDLPFIQDALIKVEILQDNPEMADIIIISKDLWSKAFFLEMKDIHSGKLEIFEKNLFGSGLEIQNNIHWDPLKSEKIGYEAIYRNPNILGSFINSRIYYKNVFETESYGYRFERKFFTQDIKYAGGSDAYYLNTIRNVWHPDSGYIEYQINMKYFDAWAGRSFTIRNENSSLPGKLNLIIASRIIKEEYESRPDVSDKLFYQYHNKTLWLSSLALSSRSHYKSSLIYNFGRTEDIPVGFLTSITLGPEFGEFSKRVYTSLNLSGGNFLDEIGYVHAGIAFGGFHTPEGSFEQGLLNVDLSIFSNLIILGNFQFRNFFKLIYIKGYDRFNDEKVNINNSYGIRGFNQSSIFGDKKLVFNLESDAFLPINPVGFRFVAFAFADFAFLGDNHSHILSNDIFTGLGLGLRIKNERLAFPAFQLRVAWYPNLPGLSPSDFIKFLGEERFRPEQFILNAPSLSNYR